MPYRIAVRAAYDVALFIPGDEGPGGRTHGHRYTVEAVLKSDDVGPLGFVVDIEQIQPRLAAIAAELDHRLLNELEPFQGRTPSAEAQAEFFYARFADVLAKEWGGEVRLAKVRVTQEPDAWAEYEP
jgi:6-pyruvoyltetrahydropterin/6-carboxytetrahydropterin synthase